MLTVAAVDNLLGGWQGIHNSNGENWYATTLRLVPPFIRNADVIEFDRICAAVAMRRASFKLFCEQKV